MKSIRLFALVCLSLLTLLTAGCAREYRTGKTVAGASGKGVPSGIGPRALEGLDAREALALANRWGTHTPEVQSYVDTEAVKFTFKSSNRTVEVPLPEDRLVVAFAPYVAKTHPCEIHYMSGCQGELVETPVKVVATLPDGEILVDEEMETMVNGFLELWLPRNREITVSMEALGRKVLGTVGTYPDSNTCITTFQLM
jgi:hypothetical protein